MGLFDEQVSRHPNLYPWTQDVIDALWTSHWTPNEFSFRADYSQFHTELTKEEQQIILRAVSAIGQIEIAVKRFWGDIGRVFPHPSISDMGFVMANNEVIHGLAYEKLLDVLNLKHTFDEILEEPIIKGRVDYLKKYTHRTYENDRKQYVYALILFTLFIENTSLFGPFTIIQGFHRFKNVLKDTAQQVNYTRIEEDLHSQAGILLINTLREEYPELFDEDLLNRIREEVSLAVKYESRVIDWMMGDYSHENLSAPILKAYLFHRLNVAMTKAGFEPLELTPEEQALLPKTLWMEEELKGLTLTDFFQQRPVEYTKHHRSYDEEDLF